MHNPGLVVAIRVRPLLYYYIIHSEYTYVHALKQYTHLSLGVRNVRTVEYTYTVHHML